MGKTKLLQAVSEDDQRAAAETWWSIGILGMIMLILIMGVLALHHAGIFGSF